jgi:hypothetical protein
MALALDVVNDLLQQNEESGRAAWEMLMPILMDHREIHRDQLEYWALGDSPPEDCFALTPLVRQLRFA